MNKRIAPLVLALAAAIIGFAAQAQEVTLKVHHFWNPQAMPPTKILQPWCDKLAAESNNRLKCQIFPAMQLGGTPPQLIDQVRDGVVDVAFTLPGYTAGRFPVMEVFELPFMTTSAESGSKAAWEFYTKYGQKEFASVHPLMFAVHDNGYVHTREKQVKTMADLRGLKMRAPTRMTNKLLASLGATPVAMPLPAVAEAVNKGVIDGFLLPWEVIPSVRLQEMVKYHAETDDARPALYTAAFILAMNKAKYDALPADLKAIVDKQQRRRPVGHGRQDLGREQGARAARPRPTAATCSTPSRPANSTTGSRLRRRSTTSGSPTWTRPASPARRC